jgi:hypothetical protein
MTYWIAFGGVVGITVLVALIDRWLDRDETSPSSVYPPASDDSSPSPVHYGHTDVADHEYDDLPHTPR